MKTPISLSVTSTTLNQKATNDTFVLPPTLLFHFFLSTFESEQPETVCRKALPYLLQAARHWNRQIEAKKLKQKAKAKAKEEEEEGKRSQRTLQTWLTESIQLPGVVCRTRTTQTILTKSSDCNPFFFFFFFVSIYFCKQKPSVSCHFRQKTKKRFFYNLVWYFDQQAKQRRASI